MSGEQDMRKMGGLAKYLPWTNPLMWIGSLSLAGIGIPFLFGGFGFAGFHSKDTILEAAWGSHSGIGEFAFWLGIAAAFMTAFYSWRLLFMTFTERRGRSSRAWHAHDRHGSCPRAGRSGDRRRVNRHSLLRLRGRRPGFWAAPFARAHLHALKPPICRLGERARWSSPWRHRLALHHPHHPALPQRSPDVPSLYLSC
jgi:hypothetical protein